MKTLDDLFESILKNCKGPSEAKTLLRKAYITRRATKCLASFFFKPCIVVNGDDSDGFFVSIYSTRLKPSLMTFANAVTDAFPGALPFVDFNPLSDRKELEIWFCVPPKCYQHVR